MNTVTEAADDEIIDLILLVMGAAVCYVIVKGFARPGHARDFGVISPRRARRWTRRLRIPIVGETLNPVLSSTGLIARRSDALVNACASMV
jgi:hypothetical protein